MFSILLSLHKIPSTAPYVNKNPQKSPQFTTGEPQTESLKSPQKQKTNSNHNPIPELFSP